MGAHATRNGGEIDVRIFQRSADIHPLDPAAMPRRHGGQIHIFLMIGAVVVDHIKDGDLVVCRRPQRSGIEHEVAVTAEGDRETAILLVCQRSAERSR